MDMTDDRIELLRALGARYHWGAGALRDGLANWPSGPWDCSGFAQAALLRLGLVRPDAWADMTAHDLANACTVVQGQPQLGDLAFYGRRRVTHVVVCLGDGMTIGANGGGSRTRGQDPKACVQVRPLSYRGDLVVVGRLKARWRP